MFVFISSLFNYFLVFITSDSIPLWYQSLYIALDRYRDLIGTNNSINKFSTKTFEDLSEHLESLTKTQNLLFNKVQTLENKVNDILEILKSKDQQFHFSTNELDKFTTQLSKLSLGNTTNQTLNKFVLAKPRK